MDKLKEKLKIAAYYTYVFIRTAAIVFVGTMFLQSIGMSFIPALVTTVIAGIILDWLLFD